jgi:prepilin-type N-terminal cleavage/methylation domain-containing protein
MTRPTTHGSGKISALTSGARNAGFTILELLITVAIIGIVAGVALPALSAYYGGCCLKAAMYEITGMIKEAKQNALLNDRDYAVSFDTDSGKISLASGQGNDGKWNSADDVVIRSFRLAGKGGSLSFGYGSCGPVPNLVVSTDGVTFPNNTLVCNTKLTGSSGTVYIQSDSGSFMAVVMNTKDYGYKLWRWDGGKWVMM